MIDIFFIMALYPNGFKITLRILLQNVKQFKNLKAISIGPSFYRSRVGRATAPATGRPLRPSSQVETFSSRLEAAPTWLPVIVGAASSRDAPEPMFLINRRRTQTCTDSIFSLLDLSKENLHALRANRFYKIGNI